MPINEFYSGLLAGLSRTRGDRRTVFEVEITPHGRAAEARPPHADEVAPFAFDHEAIRWTPLSS